MVLVEAVYVVCGSSLIKNERKAIMLATTVLGSCGLVELQCGGEV